MFTNNSNNNIFDKSKFDGNNDKFDSSNKLNDNKFDKYENNKIDKNNRFDNYLTIYLTTTKTTKLAATITTTNLTTWG